MKVGRFATQFQCSIIALALMSVCLSRALAQDGHSQALAPQHHELTPDQQNKACALIKIVRESTERFKDVSVAQAEDMPFNSGA